MASLTYYVHIDTAESGTTANDTMTVRAGATAVQSLSNLNAASGYQPMTVDLSAYAGQTISLSFIGVENSSLFTSFVVDDTAVIISSSPPPPPPPPSTVPGAPTGAVATAGNAQAAVSWAAPASNGGSSITSYRVTASPAGKTATTTGATTVTVAGLTNGTSYTFTVTATNATGTSVASAASVAVTPKKAGRSK